MSYTVCHARFLIADCSLSGPHVLYANFNYLSTIVVTSSGRITATHHRFDKMTCSYLKMDVA